VVRGRIRTVTSLGGALAPGPPEANSAKGTMRAGNSTSRLSGITTLNPEIETEPPRLRAVPAFADALGFVLVRNSKVGGESTCRGSQLL
jgi:hypothetical protein